MIELNSPHYTYTQHTQETFLSLPGQSVFQVNVRKYLLRKPKTELDLLALPFSNKAMLLHYLHSSFVLSVFIWNKQNRNARFHSGSSLFKPQNQ